jgi:hypothetical protein
MNMIRKQQHLSGALICGLTVLTALVVTSRPARAQDEATLTGTVVSSSRNTLTVRSATGQFQLFVFERSTRKPATLPVGSQVRITSSPGEEPGVRVASDVTVLEKDTPGQGTAMAPAVPPEVHRIEGDIERQVRRFQLGVRAGVALDPELVLVGVQAQVGPFFHPDVYFRPNVEFAYGEVTALFALNPEVIYRLPISSRQGRWSSYVGIGPGFNFLHQNFERNNGAGKRIDFGDFHSDVGLNILGGMRYRSGMFMELKTTVYSDPSPTLRLIVGYNF